MRLKWSALAMLATLTFQLSAAEAPPPASSSSSAGSTVNSELFLKLQQMEQELLELRGRIEEQSHDIEQLKTRQKEHYLDFDRRISELKAPGTGQPAPATTTETAPQPPATATQQPAVAATPAPAAPATGNAEESYKSAYQLIKDRRFDEARSSFEAFVQRFPKGDYTANAYYWLGELYLLKSDWDSARRAFTKVISDYPQHQKTPDAMYKLGVAYHKMGQADRAKEMLQKTRSIFPDSSAARLAEIYLREIK